MKLLHYISSPCSSAVAASLCLLLNFPFDDSTACAQDSITWGPVIQLSPDSTNNYTPHIATTGNAIHSTWRMENAWMMPYIRSVNDGVSFEQPRDIGDSAIIPYGFAYNTILSYNGILTIVFNPPGTINFPEAIYSMFSSDEGATWSYPIASSPTDESGIIYAGAMYKDTIVVVADNKAIAYNHLGLARTTNRGVDWSWTRDSIALLTASLTLSPGTLHFTSDAGINSNEFYGEVSYRRSTNLGTTWYSTTILSDDDIYSSDYSALGAYTDDSGHTTIGLAWRDAKYGMCGFAGAGIPFRLSTDYGESWSNEIPLHENEPCGLRAKVVVLKNVIVVAWASSDVGFHIKVRVSMNRGESWSNVYDLTAGGNYGQMPDVALSPTAVHVAWEEARNGGWHIFYCRGQLPITSVKDEEQGEPISITLAQNYPNPFNPTTTIKFSISLLPPLQRGTGGFVTLKIYNIYGQEVATLINNKQMEAGEHSVEWNAEKFPGGMYFYRLTVMNGNNQTTSLTKKMIVMK